MKYCSECGDKVESHVPAGDTFPRFVCRGCAWIHYENPKVIVSACLHHEQKLLWTQRGTQPFKGKWGFPHGFLEKGETLQQAASRELQEEMLIERPPKDMIPMSLASVLVMDQVYIAFRCCCLEEIPGTLTPETMDWRWCAEQDAPWSEMAHPQVEPQVRQVYEWLKNGEFEMRVGEVTQEGSSYSTFPIKGSSGPL